jgi:PAS domain S-box-containing protein
LVRERPSQEDNECIDGRPITWTCPDGRQFEFELYARPLSAYQRGDLGHLAMLQDVTDRRRAEVGMRTAAEEWTQTFDALTALVVIVDSRQRIHRINLTARELLGRSFQEIIHRPLAQFATAEPFRTIHNLVETETAVDGSITELNDGDSGKTWAISVSAVRAPNGASHNIFLARDITELVQLRDSLRANEALSTLGSLVGGVAHQVRNPLFTISATLDTLDAVGAPSDEHQVFLSVLRQQVQRLDAVMKDLLSFGRPQDLVLKDGAIAAVLRDAIKACEIEAVRRNVAIFLQATEQAEDKMAMDSSKLLGALHNVLENAVQHSPYDSRVMVYLESRPGALVCRVVDSGPGFIDAQRVFEPFYTRRLGGTGLGLPIAKRVIEQHGGSIHASNAAGGGGEVTITLPIPMPETEHAASFTDRG